jgi:hypothetical protein
MKKSAIVLTGRFASRTPSWPTARSATRTSKRAAEVCARRGRAHRAGSIYPSRGPSPTHAKRLDLSHHFDTPTGREDPRLNLCDFYLFASSTGNNSDSDDGQPGRGPPTPRRFATRPFTRSTSTPTATDTKTCPSRRGSGTPFIPRRAPRSAITPTDSKSAAPITGPDGNDGDLLACGYTTTL